MRLREVGREALRDVASGAAAAVVSAVVFAVLLGAVTGLRAGQLAADIDAASVFVASGAATTVQSAEGRIDGAACEALTGYPSVLAAGALRKTVDGTVPAALPGAVVPTWTVTPGLFRVVGVTGRSGGAGVVVAADLADELGIDVGSTLPTVSGATTVRGVHDWPDDGRDPDLGYAVLEPALDDGTPFDACWATIWPLDDDAEAAVRRTVVPSTGGSDEARATSGQLNPRLGTTFVRTSTADAALPVVVGASAGVVVGAVAVFRRRLSLSSDRHVGVPRSAQAVGVAVQQAVWACVGAVVAVAVGLVVASGSAPADVAPVVFEAVHIAVAGVAGVVIGGIAATCTIRERSLHRYFRTR